MKEESRLGLVLLIGLVAVAGCGGPAGLTTPATQPGSAGPTSTEVPTMAFTLTSAAFTEGGPIPTENTCDGANKPIPLAWLGVPAGTAELALVMDDPDARGYVHWVVVGIPPSATGLGGDAPLPAGARDGRRSGGVGYTGPCPPSGTHHYVFTLYALSSPLSVPATPTADEVRQAAANSTLATATLSGTYTRSR
jgi:Raf kinase inhibitor-like YbhB/YbcL family protein